MATFSPGYMFGLKEAVTSLSGDIEYYLSEKVSIDGEGSIFLSSITSDGRVSENNQLFGGLNYHFTENKKADVFLGMQPGVAFFDAKSLKGETEIYRKPEIIPLISFSGGVNYYVGSIFHFFIHMRYIQGEARQIPQAQYSLNEIRLLAGLGFNLGVK
ncbi:MAG: hypothetical protein WED33_05600 [Bacteroidia bacterium]